MDTEISSLAAKDSGLDTDVSSLNAADGVINTSISSLETAKDADVSSLAVKDSDLDSDISSLASVVNTQDVFATQESITNGSSSISIDWTNSYTPSSNPAVVGTLRSTSANDPIIGVQMVGAASTTGVTFVFSDDIPNGNYVLDVMASV
jgi:uncharacterized protein HemX